MQAWSTSHIFQKYLYLACTVNQILVLNIKTDTWWFLYMLKEKKMIWFSICWIDQQKSMHAQILGIIWITSWRRRRAAECWALARLQPSRRWRPRYRRPALRGEWKRGEGLSLSLSTLLWHCLGWWSIFHRIEWCSASEYDLRRECRSRAGAELLLVPPCRPKGWLDVHEWCQSWSCESVRPSSQEGLGSRRSHLSRCALNFLRQPNSRATPQTTECKWFSRSFIHKALHNHAYLSRAHITGTDHVLHLAWHEQVSELLWQRSCTLRDVDVADDEHELTDTVHRHFDKPKTIAYFLVSNY